MRQHAGTALTDLQARPQWVAYRTQARNGKTTRVPCQPDGQPAKTTDPTTWSTYAQVVAAVDTNPRLDGVGYVLAEDDPYVGIDVDDALTDGGELHPAVIELVERLGTYAEWSPSDTGVHVLVRADKHGERCSTTSTPWGGEFAAYTTGRYLTVTGRRLPFAPDEITSRQTELDALVHELLPEPTASRTGTRAPTNGTAAAVSAVRPAGRTAVAQPSSASRVRELLRRYEELAKIVDHRRTKPPKDDSLSGWDFLLAREAIALDLPDEDVVALMRHHRAEQIRRRPEAGPEKAPGDLDGYLRRTLRKLRPVPLAPDTGEGEDDPAALLGELDVLLDVAKARPPMQLIDIDGVGDRQAPVTFVFDDGTRMGFAHGVQIARSTLLCEALASDLGISTSINKQQAMQVSSLVRRYLGRTQEIAEEREGTELGLELLEAAHVVDFDMRDQRSRWQTWRTLQEQEPGETTLATTLNSGEPVERTTRVASAEGYAKGVLVPRDRETGELYVRASWVQEYARRRGALSRPSEVADLFEHIGWRRRGSQGRIKATEPDGSGVLVTSFYIVSAAWIERELALAEHEYATEGLQVPPGDDSTRASQREGTTASRARAHARGKRHPAAPGAQSQSQSEIPGVGASSPATPVSHPSPPALDELDELDAQLAADDLFVRRWKASRGARRNGDP